MPMPSTIGAIDLMMGLPGGGSDRYASVQALVKDRASQEMAFPAEHLYGKVPDHLPEGADPIAVALQEMDRCGVELAMLSSLDDPLRHRALQDHPSRFLASVDVDPNDITGAVRRIRDASERWGIKAVGSFPAGCNPPVPVSDRRYYPIYQTCVDLDLPIMVNAGIAGPRVPSACQDVMHFDQVCYDFPELRIVMRHGAEPWEELAVKLMLKWPGLYYMTSGFAPKYYPKAIIDFANGRGADKVMYAGYYPMGLSLRRIFDELPDVPLKEEVWPKFLRDNAIRVFNLDLPGHAS